MWRSTRRQRLEGGFDLLQQCFYKMITQECILCLRSYHTDCAEDWQSTMMDFFLCKPCHAIEAAKGCQVLEEEEEPVRCKQSFVSLKKVGFENAGYKL